MEIRDHRLILGGIPASDLVREFGSPLYAYEEETVRDRCRRVRGMVSHRPFRPRFSVKANANPRIVSLVLEEGLDLEVVSPGEMALALAVGAPPDRIHYFGAGMTRDEMAFSRARGVGLTVDTLAQLEAYAGLVPGGSLGVRLNPGAGLGHHAHVITGGPQTKFGVPVEHAGRVRAGAARLGIRISGVHMHVGSNFLDGAPMLELVDVLLSTARLFPDLEWISIGGGFGVAYKPSDRALDLGAFGALVSARFAAFCKIYGKAVTLVVEPGRYLVAKAGFLLARVSTVQQGLERTFVVTDTGFNHLIRPAMYGAYHPILKADGADLPSSGKVDVCGNICETGDVFQRDYALPSVEVGDVLAITHAGAYGYVMASTYNTRPLPAEVMVKGGKARIIRRRETPEALAARELELAGFARQAGH
jgi:diaminopimelate decarboxylase